MAGGLDVGPVTRSRAAHSSSTVYRSGTEVPTALSTFNKVLQALQEKSVRKAVAEITDQDVGAESSIKLVADDALTGGKIQQTIKAAVTVALT